MLGFQLLAQTTDSNAAAAAGGGMMMTLLSAVVGFVVGTVVWGLMLKFLVPAIGKQPIDWNGAFKTGFVISAINAVLGVVLSFIPLGSILAMVLGFIVAMMVISKMRNLPMGPSALITLIAWVIVFVVMIGVAIVVAVLAGILGFAAAAATA